MGGYHTGNDAEIDAAVVLVPRIYETLRQSPGDSASKDAFAELAQVLKGPGG